MTEREQANRELAAKLLHCYRTNNHQGILKLVTPDCEFRIGAGASQGVVPYHGIHTGHDQIAAYLRKRHASMRRPDDACELEPPGGISAGGRPERVNEPEQRQTSNQAPLHERMIAHGDTVIAIGRLRDQFGDGTDMHDSEFVLVFRIDPKSDKISSFHYFVDTAAIMRAWEHRGPHHHHR